MKHIITDYLLSVNSETGDYFLGEHKLKTQAQIDSVINYEVNELGINNEFRNKPQGTDTTPKLFAFRQFSPQLTDY